MSEKSLGRWDRGLNAAQQVPAFWLTPEPGSPYNSRNGAPSAYGLDDAPPKLLTFSEERPPIRLGGFRFVGFPVRREVGAARLPGCLKSESEERETWTAGSLRTASSNGEGISFRAWAFSGREAVMEETLAVYV